ncbi:DUF3343 domain-containing protein [Clostridium aestuarii]|uniref:DUF3343 domain-containing protein n=1 Tax=Clostridium aestuarii TaxID=338193 RepID=A0ABT4CUV1_9CLOT|nr:DUF3343 domain-containing protein [Clostridium aestuarii]
MKREEDYIIVFDSANHSIVLYKTLKEKGYNVKIISTPCTISAGCARAVRVKKENIDEAKKTIIEKDIKVRSIYQKKYIGNSLYYIKSKN